LKKRTSLIFIHLPRTGGTTLSKILKRQYCSGQTFSIKGSNNKNSIKKFKNLSQEKRKKIRYLEGHVPFGLHKYLFFKPAYITILRHPVNRLISHFYLAKSNPNHYLYSRVKDRDMSFVDYIQSKISSELDNGQTRLLSGLKAVDTVHGHGKVTEKVFRRAKKNIKEFFPLVGTTEKFDHFLILLKEYFKWNNVFYFKKNVSPRKKKIRVNSKIRKIIEENNQSDLKLYQYVNKKLDKLIKKDKNLGKKLKRFRRLNKIYSPLLKIYNSICRL